jgi:hypothetical protein
VTVCGIDDPYSGFFAAPSKLDGFTNIHPNSRPTQLPRIRRGMYRPAEISSHGFTSSGIGVGIGD